MDSNLPSMKNRSSTTKSTRDKKLNVSVNLATDNKKLLMLLVLLNPLNLS